MEEINISYDHDLESRILNIVSKIKNNRNRPCYQNIQTMLERGDKIIGMEDLVNFVDSLIDKKLLINKGAAGKESFCLFESSPENNIDNNIDAENKIEAETKLLDKIKDNHLLGETFEELDNSFYYTLKKVIKDEVVSAVRSEIKNHALRNNSKDDDVMYYQKSNDLWSNDPFVNRNNDALIDVLKSEITFLRNELTSVINLLHKERKQVINPISIKPTPYKPFNYGAANDSYNSNNGFLSGVKSTNTTNVEVNHSRNNSDGMSQDGFSEVKRKNNNNKRAITIIGGSIVKDIKAHEMRKSLPNNVNVYVKSFSGATVDCMKSYVQPSMKFNPNVVILNTGTNDLRSKKQPEQIADDILNLALSIKSDDNEIVISGIVPRNDGLNPKGIAVNNFLKQKLPQNNIAFIDNENINPKMHLNNSGLHPNYKGVAILANNFIDYIKL